MGSPPLTPENLRTAIAVLAPPFPRKLGVDDRFAGLYIRQHRFPTSAIFAVSFQRLPLTPPLPILILSNLHGPFFHLVFTECRNSKNFGFYGPLKMAGFEPEMYHHLPFLLPVIQFPRYFLDFQWSEVSQIWYTAS